MTAASYPLRLLSDRLRGCLCVLVAFGMLLCCAEIGAQTPIPELSARITDLTATLNAEQIGTLDAELAALEKRKGAQIAVLMIATLATDDTIEQYATRVFERWKLGRKGVDDGVLLIVVKNDHKVRIEVGYGLEGAIPDAAATRIIREYIAPKFRGDYYYGGVHEATTALTSLIEGDRLPAPLDTAPAAAAADPPFKARFYAAMSVVQTIIASLMLGFLLASTLRRVFVVFPIRVIPIVARRSVGLLAGPLIIVVFCWWVVNADIHEPRDVMQLPLAQWVLAAAITGWLGWSIAAGGASQKWAGGTTWGELFAGIFYVIINAALSIVTGGLLGGAFSSSSGSGGFSGGGGRSGGGGASGRW